MQQNTKLEELKRALEEASTPHEIIAHPPITTVQEGLDYLGITASEGGLNTRFHGRRQACIRDPTRRPEAEL
jgi:hypothetical protein